MFQRPERRLFLAAALLGAAAAGLFAILAFGAAPFATAAPPPPATTAFEYRVLVVDFDEYRDAEVYKQAERDLGSPFRATLRMHELALNRVGAEGWELVETVQKTPAQALFYLKRAATK